MIKDFKMGVAGVYANLSDIELQVEFERVAAKLDTSDATVFSRMLRELHAHQIELEMQHRELLKAKQKLEESRGHYFNFYESSALNYFSFNQEGVVMEANLAAANLLGMERCRLLGISFINFVAQPDRENFLRHLRQYLSGEVQTCAEFLLELQNGKSIEVQMTGIVPDFVEGKANYCRVVLTDISERRLVELKLQLLEKALENIQEGIILTDAQSRIVAVNPAFSQLTGYRADEVVGKSPAILKSGFHGDEFYREIYDSVQKKGSWQGEIRNRHKDGEICLEWLNVSVVRNDNGEADYYIGVYSDISSHEDTRKRLHKLAYYDELTGLPNRTLLNDRLSLGLAHSKRDAAMMAILFIDLDGFKAINDLHGHLTGDQLLMEVAKRLLSCVREGDTLSRIGGDEFVALLRNIADEQVTMQVAERMLEACAEPFVLDGKELFVTASVGISLHPRDGESGAELLKNADAAMYRAKDSGKNNYRFFSESAEVN